jgi:hypothetical protein
VREPHVHEDPERLGQELDVAVAALEGATQAVEAPKELRPVARTIEVLAQGMLDYYVDEANPPRPKRIIVQPDQLAMRVTAQNCPMIEKSFHLSRTNNRPIVIPLP